MRIKEKLCKSSWVQFLFLSVMGILVYNASVYAENAEDWMPDPALREAVREKLSIPADTPLNPAYVQLHLTGLQAINKGIVDLTGLEHATDLQFLALPRNKIHDLSPLSGLIGLVFLDLGGNQISDISPLSGLVNLEVLRLEDNQITDVSPLAGLVNLKELVLSVNPISDISPLVGLENLEDLRIQHTNTNGVFSTLPRSKLRQFGYAETCDLAGIPVSERVESREYPSVFSVWGNIINLPSLSWKERLAYHDLRVSGLLFGDSMKWLPTPEGVQTLLHVKSAKNARDEMLSLNPNMLFIVGMNYWAANPGEYSDDWPYWARDELGNIIQAEDHGTLLIDFTYPGYQDLMVRRAVQFAKCGLFDGIFFDVWRDDWRNRENAHYYTYDVHEAALTMLRRIREGVDAVRDNFLIIVNTNDTKIPHSAPYVNGMFMETIGPYTRQHIAEIESTLLWGEQNLREPKINCLEGWAITSEPLDSPKNQQRMRLFTTMSLALSDGYVLFSDTYVNFHNHYWYPFWDADLGRPIGGNETKGQRYENREGLFIREFTNGWAVYNRSGTEQTITLPMETTGVASGITATRHTVPDLDGEMFLKHGTGTSADVNGDGVVNVLDLVLVAQHLGETAPSNSKVDVNGDGIVNILDLILIAQHLGGEMAAAPAMVSGAPDAAVIQAWIKQAQLENDGSIAFQRGIVNLQRLLASLIPEKTVLLANYPNPFNPETWIPYHLADPSNVQITIYDTRGSIIRHLKLGHQHPGYYATKNRAAYWDGRNEVGERVANGIYFYQLQADQVSVLRKMVILK